MSIELDNNCARGIHAFKPIIEGTQTVGIFCINCPKIVREDMAHSEVTVDETKIIFPPTFFEQVKNQSTRDFIAIYHRKGHRF
jgi:hypothetical protein